jgi:hypothetical protein
MSASKAALAKFVDVLKVAPMLVPHARAEGC